MHPDAKFSTLIVTYNNSLNIIPLLTDIYTQAPPPINQIIVVDNASEDRTVPLIRSRFPNLTLISNRENVGFSKAVNQGFALCNTEFFFLINPDIRITDPNFFLGLIECMDKSSSIAAIGPMQFKESRDQLSLNFTWSYLNPQGFRLYLLYQLKGSISVTEPIDVPFLNAGCLLVRSSAFQQIGMLNERYFLYGEEPDLFLKLKEHDFTSHLVPFIRVIHFREHSFQTLSLKSQILLKLSAIPNISHALLSGTIRILRKKWKQKPMEI
jgi:hypothetical protein